jgi:hypothetical protein
MITDFCFISSDSEIKYASVYRIVKPLFELVRCKLHVCLFFFQNNNMTRAFNLKMPEDKQFFFSIILQSQILKTLLFNLSCI